MAVVIPPEKRINGEWCISEPEAQSYIGRGRTTLWEWRRNGMVKAYRAKLVTGHTTHYYTPGSLRAALREAKRRKANQLHVVGPGRGHKGTPPDLAERRAHAERRRAEREQSERDRRAAVRARAEAAERAEDEAYALSDSVGAA